MNDYFARVSEVTRISRDAERLDGRTPGKARKVTAANRMWERGGMVSRAFDWYGILWMKKENR